MPCISWVNKFKKSDVEDGDFYSLDGNTVHVPFMTSRKKQCVSAFDGFKVLQRPYNAWTDGRRFSMYIYLPDAKDGLASLVDRMCSEHGFLDKYVTCSKVSLREFKIPKFKFNYQHELSKDLKSMGLELPFRPGGLMEMMRDPEAGNLLFVTAVYHNSFIEVNEEGTEAAAVTAAVLMACTVYHNFFICVRDERKHN